MKNQQMLWIIPSSEANLFVLSRFCSLKPFYDWNGGNYLKAVLSFGSKVARIRVSPIFHINFRANLGGGFQWIGNLKVSLPIEWKYWRKLFVSGHWKMSCFGVHTQSILIVKFQEVICLWWAILWYPWLSSRFIRFFNLLGATASWSLLLKNLWVLLYTAF